MARTSRSVILYNNELPDKNLPIEIIPKQLNWGCVKVGENHLQKVVVRNRSLRCLCLKVRTNTERFKLSDNETENKLLNSIEMLLWPVQLHTFKVNFLPTAPGPYTDKLLIAFTSATPRLQHQQPQIKQKEIFLFAYGGHALICLKNSALRNNSLELGDFTFGMDFMVKYIRCSNAGDVPGFVHVTYEPETHYPFPLSVSVAAQNFVVAPQQHIVMFASYWAGRADKEYFEARPRLRVFQLGVVRFYTGAEALRQRLKRLVAKKAAMGCKILPLVKNLTRRFQYEERFPDDLGDELEEDVQVIDRLLEEITVREVVLTVRCKVLDPLFNRWSI